MHRPALRVLQLALLPVLAACSRPSASSTAGVSPTEHFAVASAEAARALVTALPDSTRSVALLPFEGAVRMGWHFIPTEAIPAGRAGLTLKRMAPAERESAFRLLGTALSPGGYRTARAIMDNEPTLRAIEEAAGTLRLIRDPERYFVTVFDTATGAEPWGWRFEGHHLSVNVTGAGAQMPVVAPLFFGANPHRVPSGPRAGTRLLAAEEDLARELVAMFTGAARSRAIVSDTTYGDILSRDDPKAPELRQVGVAASEMTPPQQAKLRSLLDVYAARMEPSAARAQWERIEAMGFGRLRFVWAGSTEVGKAHYYRIHGPTVLVEYDNSQNNANHSHTVWRDLENDFGGDLLRKHYQQHKH